jgi:uncharacterized membrane protein
MDRLYNKLAGGSLERIAALSDGVFAVAMTLIVLDIHVPAHANITTEGDLWRALGEVVPHLVTYLMSFLTLGIFWVGQQTQLNHFVRADRNLAWIHILFLALIALLPFATSLLAEFITYRLALVLYWLNILAFGPVLLWSWRYASCAGLVQPDAPGGLHPAIVQRILSAQALYAIGAALCVVSTFLSIGLILIVQLNYALAPVMIWKGWTRRRDAGA